MTRPLPDSSMYIGTRYLAIQLVSKAGDLNMSTGKGIIMVRLRLTRRSIILKQQAHYHYHRQEDLQPTISSRGRKRRRATDLTQVLCCVVDNLSRFVWAESGLCAAVANVAAAASCLLKDKKGSRVTTSQNHQDKACSKDKVFFSRSTMYVHWTMEGKRKVMVLLCMWKVDMATPEGYSDPRQQAALLFLLLQRIIGK